MIQFACPACRSLSQATEHLAGTKITSGVCGQRLLVPAPATAKTMLGERVTEKPIAAEPLSRHTDPSRPVRN